MQRVPQRPLPPLPCPPSDSSPTRRRSPNQGDEPLRQSSAKSGNEKRHLSAMDVAAQGISEVLWQDKGSSSGGMQVCRPCCLSLISPPAALAGLGGASRTKAARLG